MKSAAHQAQSRSYRSSRARSGSQRRGHLAGEVFENLLKWFAIIITLPVRLLWWLTSPGGSSIALGMATVYFCLVNVEGYWLSMGAERPFLPKPFIEDGASLFNILWAITSAKFWLACIISIAVQGVQSFVMRDIQLSVAQAQYDAVKDYRVPEGATRRGWTWRSIVASSSNLPG